MPGKFLRPCAYPMCRALDTDMYCPKHAAEYQAQKAARDAMRKAAADASYNKERPTYHTWYKTPRWRRYRIAFLAKHPWCMACQRDSRRTFATEVDHTIPHRGDMNLFWSESNHQGLCESCHSKKTFKENGGTAFGKAKSEQPPTLLKFQRGRLERLGGGIRAKSRK